METSKVDLLQTLRMMAKPQPSLEDVFTILSDFKNLGGTQAEALEVLEQLRSESQDDEIEDCILEMMDIAVGFCAPRLRVWQELSPHEPNPLTEPLRSLFQSEPDYRWVQQWWAEFWTKLPGSTPWQSPWLKTTFADGTPMLDGNGILSAKHPAMGRALQIIQEDDEGLRGRITWWKQTWYPDGENLTLLVIVIVPSTETLKVASDLMSAWAKGDEVADCDEPLVDE